MYSVPDVNTNIFKYCLVSGIFCLKQKKSWQKQLPWDVSLTVAVGKAVGTCLSIIMYALHQVGGNSRVCHGKKSQMLDEGRRRDAFGCLNIYEICKN